MKFPKRTMRKMALDGKTVLLRADYNVPVRDGVISDDFRIKASLPTLRTLLDRGCKVVIISHLGRPKTRDDEQCSLRPIAQRLQHLLGSEVIFTTDCVGGAVRMAVKRAHRGQVVLCENLRYHPEETANSHEFARRMALDTRADFFVQDAFGTVHRAHASTDAITQYLPSGAGLLLEKEYTTIAGAMKRPKRPLVALLGGAKVSDKIEVIHALVRIADQIIIGGAMANTFLSYKGHLVGKSKVEEGQYDVIDEIYNAARAKVGDTNIDSFIILPKDVAVAKKIDKEAKRMVVDRNHVTSDEYVLDIGDKSIERMVSSIERAQTVIWNGTMGIAEMPEFAHGSARAALALATSGRIHSIIGGGDTADFVRHWDDRGGDSFSHVSTGGGASLDLMAGKALPGVQALLDI